MIRINLKELAQKLNKTITDIANETGLNRNSITALYHNKVDGIKFDTLEKICSTYNISINELILREAPEQKENKKEVIFQQPYKQDGDMVLLTGLLPPMMGNQQPKEFFDVPVGNHIGFYKKEYCLFYWEKEKMNKAAESFVNKYKTEKELNHLYDTFEVYADKLRNLYLTNTKEEVLSYSKEEIISFTKEILKAYDGFWKLSLFIDVFDAGFDVKKIGEIQKQHGMTDEDIRVLTTPYEMTFNNDRLLELFKIIKKVIRKTEKISEVEILKTLKTMSEIDEYILKFDYYKSNYSFVHNISLQDIAQEILNFLKTDDWKKQYKNLSEYHAEQKSKETKILKKYKLKNNPFFLFQKLVFWREYRKQVNLMGIHLLHYVIMNIEKKTGIPYIYLKHLSVDEIENVFKGLVKKENLQKRYDSGVLFYTTSDGQYHIVEGQEAQSICDELEKKIKGEGGEDKIMTGRVACQGYVKGIARIILSLEDFPKFKEGEILVTGMTRPEFVPLMKKASAIVTNEGGITCHAAIVSRELGKPCIIGTQKATQLIKDGDLIEVRANHGTVRILS